jgi:hypothetical protein
MKEEGEPQGLMRERYEREKTDMEEKSSRQNSGEI